MDNSGENKVFGNNLYKIKYDINVEYTAPNTPEQNGVVERAFATLYGKARAMYARAGLTDIKIKNDLKAEVTRTVTMLDNWTY